jgi:hypothetical protein
MNSYYQSLPPMSPEEVVKAELTTFLYEAFDLYSDMRKIGEQEFLMTYEVLQSLYLSFKKEFSDKFEELEKRRAESNLENLQHVGGIYVSVDIPKKLFVFQTEKIDPEQIPIPDRKVITKQNFINGFINLILRIGNETENESENETENYVIKIARRFKFWLIPKIQEKRDAVEKYLAEELRETKRKAKEIGLYFAIKDNNQSITLHNRAYIPHLDKSQYIALINGLVFMMEFKWSGPVTPDEKQKLQSIENKLLQEVGYHSEGPNFTWVLYEQYQSGIPITELYDIFKRVLGTERFKDDDDKEIIHNLINIYYDVMMDKIHHEINAKKQRGGRRKKTFRKKKPLKKSGKTKRSKKTRKTNKKK